MKQTLPPSLFSLTLGELRETLVQASLARYGADQIYNWIYKKLSFDQQLWSNVSKKTKDYLLENFDFSLPQIIETKASSDGCRKYLLRFHDGESVETVSIPAKDRLTFCISSQVGCAMGCTFCNTGLMGFKRNLTVGEVVGQYLAVAEWLRENIGQDERLTNIVYMGQGEPLHNLDNIRQATNIFMEDKGLGIGQRKITLSTSGLVPAIEKLNNFPPVNIAISLHSADDKVRSQLMPINNTYNIQLLFQAIGTISLKARRRISYEYLLIDGLNDGQEDVQKLCKLLDREKSKINLIPFNQYPGSRYQRPSEEKTLWFLDQLTAKGFTCTIRASKGQDILAACGQLKSSYQGLAPERESKVI